MQDFGEGKMTAGRIVVRKADRKDGAAFADLVRSLAEYERLPLPEDEQLRRIREHAFGRKKLFELLIAYSGKEAVGYTVFFMTYSTFLAMPTLFIEDIFVREEFRRSGAGSSMFLKLIGIAKRRKCGRIEWMVLSWNNLAIGFYERIGGKRLEGWLPFRLIEGDFSGAEETLRRRLGRKPTGAEGEI